ncbi:ATP-grasp domain-containing protein [Paludisphaera mucosa]|uniref:ATP-grasp domain-containing protein n=1 Tax=Paludisphaera mucosa TaxID=3030827 RepID=A0ABT6FKE9_9BACT|nr:hypothetical protein [Paludisphaera mucosa]MDG3007976.1 hypothetical protein [Paludisphaera mucosa]
MPSVAIATCAQYPDLYEDDRLLADALARRGCDVTPAVWDQPGIDWNGFDRVVIRSTWWYYEKPDAYRSWLEGFLETPGRLWNPAEAVLGNIHKGYLLGLEKAGVPIVPTELARAGDVVSLPDLLERRGWTRAVIKPAISAGASDTWKVSDDPADAGPACYDVERSGVMLRDALAQRDMLIQPYLDEVNGAGEWSLVFLGGGFSHALTKTPAESDFRVQFRYGGTMRPATPPARLVDQAERVLAAIPAPLLFARVDGVEREGRFLLMELEINEPYLGLAHAPGSADHLAEAVLATL